jgi:hypothetical protein
MAVSSVSDKPLSELTQLLLKNFDTNGDGALGASEFSSLISKLASELNVAAPSAASYASSAAATAPVASLGGGPGRFEGFDLSRAQDPQKSAKDAFAMLASRAGSMPRTKAEAEQWFNSNVKTEFEGLGHKINWVQGDKFSFTNWQGTFVIDFLRGADGDDPAFAWQVED